MSLYSEIFKERRHFAGKGRRIVISDILAAGCSYCRLVIDIEHNIVCQICHVFHVTEIMCVNIKIIKLIILN
jgi:hypothetical protein